MNGTSRDFFFELDNSGSRYIYGGGHQARVAADFLNMQRWRRGDASGIIVRDREEMFHMFPNFPIYNAGDLPDREKANGHVLIAVNEKYNDEIVEFLTGMGYRNLYLSGNWKSDNVFFRNKILKDYMLAHGVTLGDGIVSYQDDDFDFKMALPENNEGYMSIITSTWSDIVMPSIFHDVSAVIEGPYEHGAVYIPGGGTGGAGNGIVIDCGANIGIFSCLAAAKGCTVYAFEPTEWIYRLLCQNQALNEGIKPQKAAVGDFTGMTKFYLDSLNVNTGMNSLINGAERIETDVEIFRLDDFIDKKNISHVEFIKADIEGAERNMLVGARNILHDFAPKLALCTYHRKDDPEVMEQLILEANPRYKIEHKWKKLYAYV